MNAQEKTKDGCIESLRIGAQEMLATEIPFEPDAEMILVDVPNPDMAKYIFILIGRYLKKAGGRRCLLCQILKF